MKISKNAIVASVGDMHINSTVALSLRSVNLDDGGTYNSSTAQNFIRETWVQFWDAVWKQKKKRKKWPLYVILNGDLADDNYHPTTQLISKNPADQLRHAVKVLERPIDMADYVFVTRGTEAHVGLNSYMDELIAQDIGAIGPPELKGEVRSWFHLRVNIGGVPFDVAHHPSTGHRVPWTKGADANRLAAVLVHRYAEYNHFMSQQGSPEHKQEMPGIALRGHNHRPSDSANNHPVRAIIHPSWQLTNSFGYRLGGDWLPIGGNYFLCRNGEVSVKNFYKMWPVADYWRAELDYEEALE